MTAKNPFRSIAGFLAGAFFASLTAINSSAAGVTLVTHGFNGTVTEWVIPMVSVMTGHPGLLGANSTCYEISFSLNGAGSLVPAQQRIGGVAPLTSDSGEIFIKLNWSSYSGVGYSTTQIANAVTPALLDPNFIPELGGHALVELPIHLVGHSRGASVISEIARLLGAQGVWVDHVTFLDPRPVGEFGDPTVRTYENVLFADNFWQIIGGLFVPIGQSISGAYNRQLTNLTSGYSSPHSDTHLWYHGTVDLATPASDTQANITATMRTNWWTPVEAAGASNGFFLSRIGSGDRLSSVEPAGAGKGRIRDGFNQRWEFGAGSNVNRTALPENSGAWPNLLRTDVTGASTNSVDDSIALNVYFQFGQTSPLNTVIELFFDADGNPFNGTAAMVAQFTDTGTGTTTIKLDNFSFNANPMMIPPGAYFVAVKIAGNGHARWLYAPQRLTLTPSRRAPLLTPLTFSNSDLHLRLEGFPGQIIVVQNSTNLTDWIDQQTNTLATATLEVVDPGALMRNWRFYRARLVP